MKTYLAILALTLPVAAQDFNVDVGLASGTPTNAYAGAANQAGPWNTVDMTGPTFTPLFVTDVTGSITNSVTLEFNKTGNGEFTFDNTLTSGDDQALLDDLCDLGGQISVVKYTFRNLQNGTYDVYTYSWAPDDPVNFITDIEVIGGMAGIQPCGGADWSGAHVQDETYVKDTIIVSNGEIRIRGSFNSGASTINGFQIVRVGAGGCNSNPVSYCTAGTSANGCQATLSASGTSSATNGSGFNLMASNVEGDKDGLFFQGTNGRQANGWGNGTSFQCVVPPVKRLGLLGKSGTSGACDGSFAQDLNAYWQANPNANPGAGAVVQTQLWYRDPLNTSNQTTSLSEALEFTVCP